MKKANLLAAACAALALGGTAPSTASAAEPVRIGFITDLSSLYSDIDGKNGAMAVQMAIDDFGGRLAGQPIELLTADHQNKADLATAKVREWIDTQKVTAVFGGTNSGVGLAIAGVARDKRRVYFNISGATAALTNEQCSPYTVHYQYDTVALAKGTGSAVVKGGGKSWFFLTADYAFGQSLQNDTARVVEASGGTVVGAVKHPLNATDFSSFLLQAQGSGATVLGLANAGGDMINAVKAAKEFGIDGKMTIASLLVFISDIHSMGLDTAQGLLLTTSWYWDMDDAARAWAARFNAKAGRMPTESQAADYSATMTYLKAVQAAGTTDADAVMATLKRSPIDDFFAKGTIRPDGRMVHDMFLMQVKAPRESKQPWDYYKMIARLPGDAVFTTKAESRCELWK